jgi:hypothetical protein
MLKEVLNKDEKHRFIPKEKAESESLNELRCIFIDAIRTTRKYGMDVY